MEHSAWNDTLGQISHLISRCIEDVGIISRCTEDIIGGDKSSRMCIWQMSRVFIVSQENIYLANVAVFIVSKENIFDRSPSASQYPSDLLKLKGKVPQK